MIGNKLQGTSNVVVHNAKLSRYVIGVAADVQLVVYKDDTNQGGAQEVGDVIIQVSQLA